MTTHTDLIARLRAYPTRDGVEAANALESLEQQVVALMRAVDTDYEQLYREANDQLAALTKERNDLLILLDNWKTSQGVTEDQLAAAQAREAKLREAQWRNIRSVVKTLADWAFGGKDHPMYGVYWASIVNGLTAKDGPEFTLEALANPTDDSALMERLKEERERCADAMWQAYLDGEESYSKLHDVIRSMT